MKIVLAESLGISEELLTQYASEIENQGHEFVSYTSRAENDNELYERVHDADILMIANGKLSTDVISRMDHLKMIDVAFTGVDHLDMDYCRLHNISVCNASGYSNTSVSELVIGQIISLYRYILEGNQATRQHKTSAGLMGFEIKDKTVGIIGTGNIGIETAKLLKAFGANVIGWSRSERKEAKDAGITYVSLEELLKTSDIVSLHLPMNHETKGFFDQEKINMMKSSAILINCARGGVVDNAALASSLNEGRLAGAAIDVFDYEPPLDLTYPLVHAKNCLLTPHVAFLTHEAMVRRAEIVFNNLQAYFNGEMINIVK